MYEVTSSWNSLNKFNEVSTAAWVAAGVIGGVAALAAVSFPHIRQRVLEKRALLEQLKSNATHINSALIASFTKANLKNDIVLDYRELAQSSPELKHKAELLNAYIQNELSSWLSLLFSGADDSELGPEWVYRFEKVDDVHVLQGGDVPTVPGVKLDGLSARMGTFANMFILEIQKTAQVYAYVIMDKDIVGEQHTAFMGDGRLDAFLKYKDGLLKTETVRVLLPAQSFWGESGTDMTARPAEQYYWVNKAFGVVEVHQPSGTILSLASIQTL